MPNGSPRPLSYACLLTRRKNGAINLFKGKHVPGKYQMDLQMIQIQQGTYVTSYSIISVKILFLLLSENTIRMFFKIKIKISLKKFEFNFSPSVRFLNKSQPVEQAHLHENMNFKVIFHLDKFCRFLN